MAPEDFQAILARIEEGDPRASQRSRIPKAAAQARSIGDGRVSVADTSGSSSVRLYLPLL
jgi:hypothetical protein